MGFNGLQFGLKTDDVVGFTESQRLAIELQMVFSITNEATWLYKNYKYPRYRNFYGYAQLMSGAFVVKSIELLHINQEIVHWQHSSSEILQSIGCVGKKILANLTPPKESVVTVALLRQRYTSVRFRLNPGIEANVNINWHFLDKLCEDDIIAPVPEQGNPPDADNKNGDPGSRPSGQPQDEKDRSNNDGKDIPDDDRPEEPKPGKGGEVGNWVFTGVGTLAPDCRTYTPYYVIPGATDKNFRPTFVRQKTNDVCPNAGDGEIKYKGQTVGAPTGVVSAQFIFV